MADATSSSRRSDSAQLIRQWTVLRLLAESGRSFTVKELAEQLEVSKPTIQRDLQTLESEFALIEEQVGKQKKAYRIDQEIRALESINFTVLELLAVHAALKQGDGGLGTPLHDELASVATKIRGFLSPRHNGGLDAMARVYASHVRGQVDYAGSRDVLDELITAISQQRWTRLTYHSPSKGTTREHRLRPLRLVWHRAALYLLGSLDGYPDLTTFAVHRIRSSEVERETFPSPRVDVEGHIRKAFGIFVSDEEEDVEIHFDETTAWRVEERQFHPDEQKERASDGRLSHWVRSSAQWEIVPWVLSFCGHAELVAPASWREAIEQAGSALASRHGAGSELQDPVTLDE